MNEEEKKKNQDELPSEDKKHNENKDNTEDKQSLSEDGFKKLVEEMKQLKKQKNAKKKPKGPKIIKVEIGTLFHNNPLFNLLMYFSLNLVVIYSIMELFDFVKFKADLIIVLLFVLTYTVIETAFRQYLVKNHFKFVLRTFGFVFFFGYLSIFYLLDVYIFEENIRFVNETLLVIFVGFFIVFRYILSTLVKTLLIKMKG